MPASSSARATLRGLVSSLCGLGLSSGTWTLTDRYLWDPASGQILTDEQVPAGGYTLWPLTDNQGTVRDIVTASGRSRKVRLALEPIPQAPDIL